jgi:RNA polymerase sigma-70 factor (sigma-E family)
VDVESDFTAYVAAHWPRLVRSAVLLGCSPTEAEDVVQSALERCLLRWRRVSAAQDRDAYVHRVLINTVVSARRRRWTGERPTSEVPDEPGPDETTALDDADAVMRALDRLGPDQRAAVVLRYYAHLGELEMATALGVAPGTVKSRLTRALDVLAEDPALGELRGAP